MERSACRYTVVRFVPDPIRNEARNIGVILQCPDLGYINGRFIPNLRQKLGGTADSLDLKVLKAYIGDFEERFTEFSQFHSTELLFADEVNRNVLDAKYLDILSEDVLSKVQFTDPKGLFALDPEKELVQLYELFVTKKSVGEVSRKGSKLKIQINSEFKAHKLLASGKGSKAKKGFKPDVEFRGLLTDKPITVDFAYQNDKAHVVETVDLRYQDQIRHQFEAYDSAIKFDELTHGTSAPNVAGYVLVALPEGRHSELDYGISLLEALSESMHFYSDAPDMRRFLSKMSDLVQANGNLFDR